ncbi:YdaS family helix-turn-helix protein [Sphingomonas sp. H39-1-10]|uniref:transcriptional regulator n=1 Tax=Sphingomonas pollutisoli TaxID=3030829 RepID=UPI0023B99BCC|nr:YdaS family helix-turn-helix protein [Sphingomonas pollutisoli]MDF0489186.1 YdaS family helix-turn-helix protein [Sphingomonas pollutisoli]
MAVEHKSDSALARAVRIAGSQSAFARLIGRAQQTVYDWLSNDKPLPAEHVLNVEARTGISRHELRPDLYPQVSAAEVRRSPGHDLGDMEPAR